MYHRFGIFSTVSGNLVLAWLFQLWKGASYRIFWKCHKNQMLSRFHQLREDQMRSHGQAPVAAWHQHQKEEELEDQDGGWWGTWSWVRPDCRVHRARPWAGAKQADKKKQCWNFFLIRWTRWRKALRVSTRKEPAPSHKLQCRSGLCRDIFIPRSPLDWH